VLPVVQEKEHHLGDVVDIYEIAFLFAVGDVLPVGAEEFHTSRFPDGLIGMEDYRGHSALMVFVGAVYVEEFKPGPEARGFTLVQHPEVEIVLGPGIEVQGLQVGNLMVGIGEALFAVAVGGRRRGIHQGNPHVGAGLPQMLGITQVQLLVTFGLLPNGVGPCTQVKHKFHLCTVPAEPLEKILPVDQVDITLGVQITLFGRIIITINEYQVIDAFPVEPPCKITAYKTRSSCNNDHADIWFGSVLLTTDS